MKILTDIRTSRVGGVTSHVDGLINAVNLNEDIELIGIEYSSKVEEKQSLFQGPNCNIYIEPISKNFIHDLYSELTSVEQYREKQRVIIEGFESYIGENNPDIILINGTAWISWCLLMAAKKFDIPTVHYYAGSLYLELDKYPDEKRELFKKIEQDFNTPTVLEHYFPSEIAKIKIGRDVFGKTLENSRVIHNGINIFSKDRDVKDILGLTNESRLSVGLICRWATVKNPDFVFELARVNEDKKGALHFNIVTDIRSETDIEKKLAGICDIHKPMEFEYLVDFYQDNDVIICPSFFETFGNVALEAIAHGVPALISDRMGVSEVFRELGLEDWIIDFSDPLVVYEKILQVRCERVPRAIQELVRMKYSFENVYQRYLNIFRESTN